MWRELNFATAILFLQGRMQIIIAKKKSVNDITCSPSMGYCYCSSLLHFFFNSHLVTHCHAVLSLSSSILIADPIGKSYNGAQLWTFCHFTFAIVITAVLLSHKGIDTINCCFTIYYPVVFVLPDPTNCIFVCVYVIPSVLSLNLHLSLYISRSN